MRSPTEAGPPEPSSVDPQLIDAINQVFALFQINYHNQYYSAFGDNTKSEQLAKNLWLNKLNQFSSDTICAAAEKIIAENDYLPTLHKMLEACRNAGMPSGLPSPRNAYHEACNSPSPKAANQWSHPVVYHAGRECGWHRLANEVESKAFPLFEQTYLSYCERLLSGEEFMVEPPQALPESVSVTASKSHNRKQLKKLQELLD